MENADFAHGLVKTIRGHNVKRRDLFKIAGAIVERLHPTLMAARGGGNPLGQRPPATTNMQAYDLYLRGLFALRDTDVHNDEEGQRLVEQALEADPTFSRARVLLETTAPANN